MIFIPETIAAMAQQVVHASGLTVPLGQHLADMGDAVSRNFATFTRHLRNLSIGDRYAPGDQSVS
jgi:hypothetical protein